MALQIGIDVSNVAARLYVPKLTIESRRCNQMAIKNRRATFVVVAVTDGGVARDVVRSLVTLAGVVDAHFAIRHHDPLPIELTP